MNSFIMLDDGVLAPQDERLALWIYPDYTYFDSWWYL